MVKVGVVESVEQFWEILFDKWKQYLHRIKSGVHLQEVLGKDLESIEDLKAHFEEFKIYMRGHNLYDIFYGPFRDRETELLTKYLELAPREDFADILEKITIDAIKQLNDKENITIIVNPKLVENIKRVIREELNKLGCEEVQMSALQNPEPWEKTGRFSDQEVDIWFKTNLSSGGELGLAPTHEEPITNMLKSYIMEKIKVLIEDLRKCQNPYNCPHGRPTIITMSKYEMEKRFKR